MNVLAVATRSGHVERVIGVMRIIARADAAGRVYALSDAKQYPLAYEHIAKRLDALELQSKAELAAELRRVRSDLAAKLKAAKSSKAFKTLPRRKELQAAIGAMLRRAWDAGREAIREEVPRAYADSSFTPKAATKWLADAEFWITDLLSDDLLSVAQRIIVNGLKTGKPASVMMVELFEAFVPYLGSRVGEDVIEPARLETIVRTNTTTAYNHGRLTEILGADVARFVDGIRYSAVLDSRTTEVCRFLDGKVFILPAGAKYRNLPATPEADIEALIPPRHFNALASGSLILTDKGSVPIEDIDVGDMVLTHRGRYRRVYAVMSKRVNEINALSLSTGRILRATDEHPILTTAGWLRCNGLKLGDVLFQHGEQMPGARSVGVSSPNDYPSLFNEPTIAYERFCFARHTSLTAVNFKPNTQRRPSKINNEASNWILKGERIAGGDQHISKGCLGFGWSGLPCFGDGLRNLFHTAMNWIARASHAVAILSRPWIAFLATAPCPMPLSAALGNDVGEAVGNCYLFDPGAHLDAESLAQTIQRSLSEPKTSVDCPDRFARLPVSFGDDCRQLVLDHKPSWCGAAIITAIKERREQWVWNLAVEEDETYHAEGIVVHNCRSLIVPIVVGSPINPDDVITAAEVAQAKVLSGEGFMLQRGVFKHYGD